MHWFIWNQHCINFSCTLAWEVATLFMSNPFGNQEFHSKVKGFRSQPINLRGVYCFKFSCSIFSFTFFPALTILRCFFFKKNLSSHLPVGLAGLQEVTKTCLERLFPWLPPLHSGEKANRSHSAGIHPPLLSTTKNFLSYTVAELWNCIFSNEE